MKWLKWELQIIGAAALVLAIILAWMVWKNLTEHVGGARAKDVLFVLNWGGIKTDQDIQVIGSYRGPRTLTGDHLDWYCIQLSKFELGDFANQQWQDGPVTNPMLADALELAVNDARRNASCFPTFAGANSRAMKMEFVSVVLHDRQATAADIILFSPKTRILYYVSFKT